MPRVVHFEIGIDRPERAVKFYEKIFGWKTQKWEGPADYWLATTGEKDQPGIDGALMPRMGKEATVITIDVPSIDDFIKKIEKAGGKAVTKKTTVLGVGYTAYCKDTEGNVFGLIQNDPSAK